MGLPVRGLKTVVRPATDDDVDLLVAWHADPETSKYWDDETFTREEMLARLHREAVDAWIVEADGEPVGYLQSWWEDDPPAGVGSTEPAKSAGAGSAGAEADTKKRGGLDGFLIPEARGRGLMPDAARALAAHLLEAGWQYVTVDPYAWNERAIKGWRNAGFVVESRHDADDEHKSPWILMRFSLDSDA